MIAARRFNVKYTVLDDIEGNLHEELKGDNLLKKMPLMNLIYGKKATINEIITKELLPHELNAKCIRSVSLKPTNEKYRQKKPNHFFKSQGRKDFFTVK